MILKTNPVPLALVVTGNTFGLAVLPKEDMAAGIDLVFDFAASMIFNPLLEFRRVSST